jgi:hypothetical protein
MVEVCLVLMPPRLLLLMLLLQLHQQPMITIYTSH